MRINKRAIEDLEKQPKPAKRQAFWDDKLAGFGVRRTPSGKISFVVKFRVRGDGQQHFETLGAWPAMLPDDARDEAADRLATASKGRLLSGEREAAAGEAKAAAREAARRAIPIEELLDGWRVTAEVKLAERLAAEQVGSYEKELLRIERAVLRPALAGRTVGTIEPGEFQDLLDRQTSRSTAGNLRGLIVQFIEHATLEMKARGMPITWPKTLTIKGPPTKRYERYTIEEMAMIWLAAGALGRRGALIRFMMLMVCRRSEGARARRSRMRLEGDAPYWLHKGGTTKNREEYRAPLSRPAVALLSWLPARVTKTVLSDDLIFAGRGGKMVSSWSTMAGALRARTGLPHARFHDFRRTVVSTLGDHGFDPVTTDKLLNHAAASTMSGVMAVYQNSEFLKQRARAIEFWADLLFAEIDRQLAQRNQAPVSRETWGFEGAFEEVRIPPTTRKPATAQAAAAPRRRRGSLPRKVSDVSQSKRALRE